jgi:hypothetical protein
MSFKAKFKAGPIDLNVMGVSYSLLQETDATGRPSTVTRGGTITVTVEGNEKTDLFEWMCNSFERKDGSVVFYKRDSDATLKELKFTEGYLINFTESFNSEGKEPLSVTFTVSAKEIKLGNGTHSNLWV